MNNGIKNYTPDPRQAGDQRGKDRNKPTVSGRAASATPPAFRDVLLALARHSTYPSTNHQS